MTSPAERVAQNSRERKRRHDPSTPRRPRAKEDEKENVSKIGYSSPSASLSGTSRESSSNGAGGQLVRKNRRKNSKPLRFDQIPVTTECSDHKKLLDYYSIEAKKIKRQPLFLVKNVKEKRALLKKEGQLGSAIPSKIISEVLPNILNTKQYQRRRRNTLFKMTSLKICSWSNGMEIATSITATAMVELYTIYVDHNDTAIVMSEGFTIVPDAAFIEEKKKEQSLAAMFRTKKILCSKENVDNAKYIFTAVVASKMTVVNEKEEKNRRRTRGVAQGGAEESSKYEKVVRFGCRLLYDKEKKMDHLHYGIQHIILVNEENDPSYNLDSSSRETTERWLSDVCNLHYANRINNRADNSHLPRLIISTDVPDEEDQIDSEMEDEAEVLEDLEEQENMDELVGEGEIYFRPQRYERLTGIKIKREYRDAICPFRDIMFDSLAELKDSFKAKYPCFEFKFIKDKDGNRGDSVAEIYGEEEFFKELTVSRLDTWFYRPKYNRSFPLVPAIEVLEVSEPLDEEHNWAPRNDVPDSSEKKFGFEYIEFSNKLPVMATVYKNRINSLIPSAFENSQSNSTEGSEAGEDDEACKKAGKKRKEIVERNEYYPINNAAMYCDYTILHQEHRILVSLANEAHDMQVVVSSLTRKETDEYNKKLSGIAKNINGTAKKRNVAPDDEDSNSSEDVVADEDVPSTEVGIDIEGNPIPTFAELFFSYGKNELYNVCQRFFFSEAGIRPGLFTADWKSRVMTGFIKANYKCVFDNKLDVLFRKQLQLIGLNTADWTEKHHNVPMQEFLKLKKQWRESKELLGNV